MEGKMTKRSFIAALAVDGGQKALLARALVGMALTCLAVLFLAA